jgi:signal transduction histidine kinase
MYNLKDGIHTIDIRGYDDSGNPVVFDTIKVNQQTDFIESTNFRYFLFFIVIILMIVTGFIYYYNNKQLNTIKVNIAMDLHDEIGSILNRSLYTMKDDPVLSKQTQLINYLSEALYGIRTYINAYNVGKVGVYQFFDELKEHLASYFKNSGIDYELNSDIDNQEYINSFVYRDLKLVFYEINQNILKHSKATAVKADFIIKNGQLYASFMDNGILKNVNDIERKGNGVTNIRKRVSRIKGEVNFSINPIGTGLKIEIKLNLAQSLIS